MLTPHCDTLFAVQLKLLEHPVDRFQPWTYFAYSDSELSIRKIWRILGRLLDKVFFTVCLR